MQYKFVLSRSTYYNHLISNRSIDYQISRDFSVRSVFEFGPTISSLKDSKLSNHIGINALVFLDDGYVVFPRRKKDSTISKNCITSSIATRLLLNPHSEKVDAKYLFNDNIIIALKERLFLDKDILDKENVKIEIQFLGLGQNIYEGGKPQMYFSVRLKGLDYNKFFDITKNTNKTNSNIDKDKFYYVAKWSSLHFHKKGDKLYLTSINQNGKEKKHCFDAEKSMFCNIWHYLLNKNN